MCVCGGGGREKGGRGCPCRISGDFGGGEILRDNKRRGTVFFFFCGKVYNGIH